MKRFVFLSTVLAAFAPSVAAAQVGPGLPTGPGTPAGEEDKGDGVAEQAPRTPGLLPTTPALPPPKSKRKRFELIEIDGYFRVRGDWMKNFNLGFADDPDFGGAPFPQPLGCQVPTDGSPADANDRPCGDSIKTTNMRLRLEPTINLDETTAVHAQIDVLDNMVLGDGLATGEDAIRVKRAWAEVTTPLGVIKFGRQPDQWGMGMFRNAGGEDAINGGYDLDSDYGDTIDRVQFGTLIPGTRLRGAISMDMPFRGPTTVAGAPEVTPQPRDADDNDDIRQWSFIMSRMDAPTDFRDTVERGEMALNYGIYLAYTKQSWTYTGDTAQPNDPDLFVPRDLTQYTPDVWLKLGWKNLLFEAEGVAQIGTINRLTDLGFADPVDIRAFGGTGRLTVRAVEDKLRFGIELGGASGDQWDNDPEGRTHISNVDLFGPAAVGDGRMSRFMFNPDYEVDLILFRELLGTVTNAGYVKPFLAYDLTNSITARLSNVTSFALKPVSTPGNESMYGVEFDGDIGYANNGFFTGIAYGVLFPLSAMNHPVDESSSGGPGFPFGTTQENAGDAGNAHTIQFRLAVSF
jgi:uncharacterized protein (TIGR04551 family)